MLTYPISLVAMGILCLTSNFYICFIREKENLWSPSDIIRHTSKMSFSHLCKITVPRNNVTSSVGNHQKTLIIPGLHILFS